MAVEIVLVRHGQSEGNRDRVFTGHGPSRLTDLGQRQAAAAAARLADRLAGRNDDRAAADDRSAGAEAGERPRARPVDHIYSSDLVRCVQTAAPLALRTGLRPVETAALRERDVGEFTGLDFAEVQRRWPEGWSALLGRDAAYRPPGGESHLDCGQRVAAFLDELLARHLEGRVVVFSHGVAINHMLRHAVGLPREATQRAYFQVENCSIQRIEHRPDLGAIRILAVNDVAHLAGLLPDEG
jgi:broad specificity phosphatase PhoE